ncbi:MAG: response regulator [Chitinophagaceae bacterium]
MLPGIQPFFCPHIVIAADDGNECVLFKQALDNMHINYSLSMANSSEMLMEMLDEKNFHPDYIFLHLHLPGIPGKVCLEALKARKNLQTVPVILYSGSKNTKDRDYCYKITPSDYFLNALCFLL